MIARSAVVVVVLAVVFMVSVVVTPVVVAPVYDGDTVVTVDRTVVAVVGHNHAAFVKRATTGAVTALVGV